MDADKRLPLDYLPSLDGVRGLAILMVIVSHAFFSNSEAAGGVTRWIGDVLGYGCFGVDLFFVLSGFLITGILVDSVESVEGPDFFRNFYMRRILRIFPLYYGVLTLVYMLTPALHLQWQGMGWLLLGYLQNLRPTQIVTYSPGGNLALNHFWSLAIEEQFYLFWPVAVYFVRDRRKLFWTTLASSGAALMLRLVLIGAGVGAATIHVTTLTRADSLLLGGTLAMLYRSPQWPRMLQVAPWGMTAAAVLVCASIKVLPRELGHEVTGLGTRLWVDGVRYTILALGSACLIAWAMDAESLGWRIFTRSWLRFLGRYSYGIYVLHMIFLPILLKTQRAAIFQVTHSKLLGVAGAGISSLALALGAAVVSFHLFEKPFLRLKRYFEYGSARETGREPRLQGRRMAADLVSSKDRVRAVSLH